MKKGLLFLLMSMGLTACNNPNNVPPYSETPASQGDYPSKGGAVGGTNAGTGSTMQHERETVSGGGTTISPETGGTGAPNPPGR